MSCSYMSFMQHDCGRSRETRKYFRRCSNVPQFFLILDFHPQLFETGSYILEVFSCAPTTRESIISTNSLQYVRLGFNFTFIIYMTYMRYGTLYYYFSLFPLVLKIEYDQVSRAQCYTAFSNKSLECETLLLFYFLLMHVHLWDFL